MTHSKEDIRLAVRDLEQSARGILTALQAIHQPDGISKIHELCKKSRSAFTNVQNQYAVLKSKVPENQYYRFHDHWRFVTQRLTFLAGLTVYLESEALIQREEVAAMLGVCVDQTEGFHIDLDDYLTGLLMMADELSRFAVNSVTSGDYSWPVKIARFVTEMNLGFRLLNLKNDSLRKKFDALKYDLKKVEEVVYDLSIRGLRPSSENQPPSEGHM
ncbi:translin-like isoform X2 [Ornithodoros turicata]|uniref:translin-like isoform X2 n=1 Tax=Ornithodoros turicata TaxID=34597 RepID=UPI00313A3B6A